MLRDFHHRGRASFIIGGQFGSEGKGAAAAFAAWQLAKYDQFFDIVTTNAAAQAGHTSVHQGKTRVCYHMPTIPLIAAEWVKKEDPYHRTTVYLNSGAIIDPDVLLNELEGHWTRLIQTGLVILKIHPNAAIITPECKEIEMDADSSTTRIASTRKGVGAALAAKVMRSGKLARDESRLHPYIGKVDLNTRLSRGASVAVEVPQGFGLGNDKPFYPHCTSRLVSVNQAMADANIHPRFYGRTLLVLRTYPIRVGNIMEDSGEMSGHSGGVYSDQREIRWSDLKVEPELTTVTRRVRRVFTFSWNQAFEAMSAVQPEHVLITFCDYDAAVAREMSSIIESMAETLHICSPEILYSFGPSTADVRSAI